MTKFLITFAVLLLVLFGLELLPFGQHYFVEPWTYALAKISAWIATSFDSSVVAQGKILSTSRSHFAVSIEAGCNGVEATLVLLAAILAFPAPWKHKILGVILGCIAVQGLNIVRVISLFYIGQWNFKAFEWAHLYIWQALIMVDVLVVFLLWVRSLPKMQGNTEAQSVGVST